MRRILLGLALALTLTGCSGDEPEPEAAPAPSTVVEVRYFVEGTAHSVSITFETPTGQQQHGGLAVPVTGEDGDQGVFFTAHRGDFVYIAAQNDGEDGDVRCRIEVDGEVVSENASEGAYSIATCKGSA